MPRFALVLLTLAAIAGGGANLYLGGLEATRVAQAQLDVRLERASNAVRMLLAEVPAREADAAAEEGTKNAKAQQPAAKASLRFDDAKARRFASIVGADLTILRDGKVEASSLPPSERALVASASGNSAEPAFGLGELPESEFALFGVPMPLLAPRSPATRAMRTALPGVDGGAAIVSVSTREVLAPAVESQKRALSFTGGIALLGLVLIALRRKDGPIGVAPIADVAERAADGDVTAHAAEYLPGELGRLARAVNRLASKARQTSASQSLSSQYSLPPRSTEAADDIADSFPFGAASAGTSAPHGFGKTPGPGPDSMGATPGPFAADYDGSRSAGPQVDPFDLARGEPATMQAPPSAPWDRVPSDPAVASRFSSWDQPTRPLVQTPVPKSEASGESWAEPPTAVAAADAYGKAIAEAMGAGGSSNPDATVVAAIPEALLRATSRAPVAAPVTDADPDEAAFRQVYEDFLRIREECGEPIAGLSYEKFALKLRSNRAQLIEKYQCRTVRFTAYVKEGKAALKASPIKD